MGEVVLRNRAESLTVWLRSDCWTFGPMPFHANGHAHSIAMPSHAMPSHEIVGTAPHTISTSSHDWYAGAGVARASSNDGGGRPWWTPPSATESWKARTNRTHFFYIFMVSTVLSPVDSSDLRRRSQAWA